MSELILSDYHDGIGIVTMNRPGKRNALSAELCSALGSTLRDLQYDQRVRSLVLYGGKEFCAGGDLRALDAISLDMRRSLQAGQRIIRELVGGRLPVVAAVEGGAYGAGFSIALACDFIVASESSTFCAAFARVGLQPDYGLLWSLPQRVGLGLARKIVMLCEAIPGRHAKELGLVDELAEEGKVLENAVTLARKLAEASPGSISATKSILARRPLSLDNMLAWEADTQSLLLGSGDFAEGVQAFLNKRTPSFEGR